MFKIRMVENSFHYSFYLKKAILMETKMDKAKKSKVLKSAKYFLKNMIELIEGE
jgi:hypothetical protein